MQRCHGLKGGVVIVKHQEGRRSALATHHLIACQGGFVEQHGQIVAVLVSAVSPTANRNAVRAVAEYTTSAGNAAPLMGSGSGTRLVDAELVSSSVPSGGLVWREVMLESVASMVL